LIYLKKKKRKEENPPKNCLKQQVATEPTHATSADKD
jgi:hypothetical protein